MRTNRMHAITGAELEELRKRRKEDRERLLERARKRATLLVDGAAAQVYIESTGRDSQSASNETASASHATAE